MLRRVTPEDYLTVGTVIYTIGTLVPRGPKAYTQTVVTVLKDGDRYDARFPCAILRIDYNRSHIDCPPGILHTPLQTVNQYPTLYCDPCWTLVDWSK